MNRNEFVRVILQQPQQLYCLSQVYLYSKLGEEWFIQRAQWILLKMKLWLQR